MWLISVDEAIIPAPLELIKCLDDADFCFAYFFLLPPLND
jgi:hypothetical protein